MNLPQASGSWGVNAKVLDRRIGGDSAADVGVLQQLKGIPLSLGLAALNLGGGTRFLSRTDPLPLTLTFGGAYRPLGSLLVAADVKHRPYDRKMELTFGTEYSLLPAISLRAGYASQSQRSGGTTGVPDILGGFAGGLGLRVSRYSLDYAVLPFGPLGAGRRLSLGARFYIPPAWEPPPAVSRRTPASPSAKRPGPFEIRSDPRAKRGLPSSGFRQWRKSGP